MFEGFTPFYSSFQKLQKMEHTSASSSLPKITEKSESWARKGSLDVPTSTQFTEYIYNLINWELW
jgi:hypothetical protein